MHVARMVKPAAFEPLTIVSGKIFGKIGMAFFAKDSPLNDKYSCCSWLLFSPFISDRLPKLHHRSFCCCF